jgi:hypothetical protein
MRAFCCAMHLNVSTGLFLERARYLRYATARLTRSSMQATTRPLISLGIASCVDNELGQEFFPNSPRKREVAALTVAGRHGNDVGNESAAA